MTSSTSARSPASTRRSRSSTESGGRCAHRSPEEHQGEQRATTAGTGSDGDTGPTLQVVLDLQGVIDRPLATAERGECKRGDEEREHVLVALALAEDEEPVLEVVGDERDAHRAHDAGGGERREQT